MSEQPQNAMNMDGIDLSEAMRAYRAVVDDKPLPPNDPGLRQLLDLNAVVPSTHNPGHHIALDPQETAHGLLWRGYEDIARTIHNLSAIPRLMEVLTAEYDRGRWRNGAGSEYIEDAVLVNDRIDKITANATEELLTAQPNKRSDQLLSIALPRDSALVERGCSMRTLYPHTARSGVSEPRWMEHMSRMGTQIRTLAIPFPRMIIIDRRHAVIENLIVEGAPIHSAWYVTDRAVVEWMVMIYDLFWDRADSWVIPASAEDHVTTATQRSILRELVAGRDQRQIATRLNISDKTLRNQLAVLRAKLGVDTTIQVIYWWATSPENDSALERKAPLEFQPGL
ncbi:helix-turn-helix transcriptional regulator [Streptomyces sp. MBT27]|uniref:helix-turn-helix domain-containing protein n=1 Tax=Streptomyces sp. MBT27 TaxID=1488356 RepID=UPI0014232882|nr:helix-turn-helix transcriptional regulator [Streptomyces sp. MBT27]